MKPILTAIFGSCISFFVFTASFADETLHNFNFNQIELGNLSEIVAGISGEKIIVGEFTTKRVSIATPEKVAKDEILPLFISVLEANKLTVQEKGGALQIIALQREASQISPRILSAEDEKRAVGVITKIIRMKHISAVEIKKLIEPMVRKGKEGGVLAFGPTNHLIVTDTASNIRQIEKIIAELDTEESAGVTEVIELKHASADQLATQVSAAIKGAEGAGSAVAKHLQQVSAGGSSLPGSFIIIPSTGANSLIVIGSPVQIADVKRIVEKLDVETAAGRGRLNAIFLNYLSAESAAKNITALLSKTTDKTTSQRIAIEPSISNNALLVNAPPADYEYIRKLVEQLDIIPQQVLVEVLIAEIAYDDSSDIGVEWSGIDQPKDGSTTVIGRSRPGANDDTLSLATEAAFSQGVSLGVARGFFTDAAGNQIPRIPFLLRAYEQDRDVKILSNVPLWVQNNAEATYSVVQNIPVLKSTIEGGAGTARDVIQNIERLDVGIQLNVTAIVNPNNEVTLKLNPRIEAIIQQQTGSAELTPTIAKREVNTTITTKDRSTVAISGLIREDFIEEVNKVPLLGSIPIIGHLFRNTVKSKNRTNLMIFVTPYIVSSPDIANELKEKWTTQTGLEEPLNNLTFDEDNKDE